MQAGTVYDQVRQILLDGLNEALEGSGFVHGEVGQYLTVEADALHLELVDELGIGQAFFPHGRVDTDDPEAAVVALLEFATNVAVCLAFLNDVFGYCIYIFTLSVKAFGFLQDPFPACFGSDGIH